MNKQAITQQLQQHYDSFVSYISGLTIDEYLYINDNKWNAAQQLNHILLCVKPLTQVFGMDKTAIAATFGTSDRGSLSYDVLLHNYLGKLNEGGKAPTRYLPAASGPDERQALTADLSKMIRDLSTKIGGFTEQELETLNIPHPLLGNITLREMLFNAIYHVQHHQRQAIENLKTRR